MFITKYNNRNLVFFFKAMPGSNYVWAPVILSKAHRMLIDEAGSFFQ